MSVLLHSSFVGNILVMITMQFLVNHFGQSTIEQSFCNVLLSDMDAHIYSLLAIKLCFLWSLCVPFLLEIIFWQKLQVCKIFILLFY